MDFQTADSVNLDEDFPHQIQSELDHSKHALQEISLMLEQSQVDMTKLTQRNAAITSHLQQIQTQHDASSKEDISMAYDSALEAQQRLFVMRGQMEKLQSDQVHLKKIVSFLDQMRRYISMGDVADSGGGDEQSSTLGMVIRAQESERQRLSRQMHDGPAQALSNFIVQTEIATRLFEVDPNKAKEELGNLKNAAMGTFQKVRTFIFELRPMMLDDLGLIPTLRRYVDAFKEQTSVDVSISVKGKEQRMDPMHEVVLFRAVQELMGNAARHNENQPGKVHVEVQLVIVDDVVKVSVSDNGKGFDMDESDSGEGIGLKVTRERAEMLRGSVDIETAVGKGCKVTIQVPFVAASEEIGIRP